MKTIEDIVHEAAYALVNDSTGWPFDQQEVYENADALANPAQNCVVKISGDVFADKLVKEKTVGYLLALAGIGIKPIVVHGGGEQINDYYQVVGKEPQYEDGQRITEPAMIDPFNAILTGLSKAFVEDINTAYLLGSTKGNVLYGDTASEVVKQALWAEPKGPDNYTAQNQPIVQKHKVQAVLDKGKIPVLSSIGYQSVEYWHGQKAHEPVNLNADCAGGAVAKAFSAAKYVVLTATGGVLDTDGALITTLDTKTAQSMLLSGDIHGGMIPKVQEAFKLLGADVGSVVFAKPKDLPLALLTNGLLSGTTIKK